MLAKHNIKKGQILIILLITLSIISVFLLILVSNVRRDNLEQIQAEQYERYYNATENTFLRFLNNQIASGESPQRALSTQSVNRDPALSCNLINGRSCTVTNVFVDSNGVLKENEVNFVIKEVNYVDDFNLAKDKTFTLNLVSGELGYNGVIDLEWTGRVAWVITIDYLTPQGEYKTTKSIYSHPSANIFNISPGSNCLNFTKAEPTKASFTISSCLGTDATPIEMRLKPIILDGESTTLKVSGDANFPLQMRRITAISNFNDALLNTPNINLEVTVPIHNSNVEILDYAIRTDNKIEKASSELPAASTPVPNLGGALPTPTLTTIIPTPTPNGQVLYCWDDDDCELGPDKGRLGSKQPCNGDVDCWCAYADLSGGHCCTGQDDICKEPPPNLF